MQQTPFLLFSPATQDVWRLIWQKTRCHVVCRSNSREGRKDERKGEDRLATLAITHCQTGFCTKTTTHPPRQPSFWRSHPSFSFHHNRCRSTMHTRSAHWEKRLFITQITPVGCHRSDGACRESLQPGTGIPILALKTTTEKWQSRTLRHVWGHWKGLYLNEESLPSEREKWITWKSQWNKTCQHFFSKMELQIHQFTVFSLLQCLVLTIGEKYSALIQDYCRGTVEV